MPWLVWQQSVLRRTLCMLVAKVAWCCSSLVPYQWGFPDRASHCVHFMGFSTPLDSWPGRVGELGNELVLFQPFSCDIAGTIADMCTSSLQSVQTPISIRLHPNGLALRVCLVVQNVRNTSSHRTAKGRAACQGVLSCHSMHAHATGIHQSNSLATTS